MGSELCFTSARELTQLLRSRAVSAREVMAAFLDQIERLNPKVNAIVANSMMRSVLRSPTRPTGNCLTVTTSDRCMACRSRSKI